MDNKYTAIVLGSDSVNALGLVQSLGREGVKVVSVLVCEKSELIRHSKYASEIYSVKDFEAGVETILEKFVSSEPTLIIPAGDGAAMALDKNRKRLSTHYLFEYTNDEWNISTLMQKHVQIDLASKYGFRVPISVNLRKGDDAPTDMLYPCIVKPLVSCVGDKRDILFADNKDGLNNILKNELRFSEEVLVQQFISRDYEYVIMGCSFANGDIYIPLSDRAVKFNHFLQETLTVSYVEPFDSEIAVEVDKIKELMRGVGYVGLFSVEFMHNMKDGKIYFTEINFRNDGINSFIVHCGANLPYLHLCDLYGLQKKSYSPITSSKKYIWEGIHFNAFLKRCISFSEWISDFKGMSGFLYYFKDDPKPFYFQFINKILLKLHII